MDDVYSRKCLNDDVASEQQPIHEPKLTRCCRKRQSAQCVKEMNVFTFEHRRDRRPLVPVDSILISRRRLN